MHPTIKTSFRIYVTFMAGYTFNFIISKVQLAGVPDRDCYGLNRFNVRMLEAYIVFSEDQ